MPLENKAEHWALCRVSDSHNYHAPNTHTSSLLPSESSTPLFKMATIPPNLGYNIVKQEEKPFFMENMIPHRVLLNSELPAQHLDYNSIYNVLKINTTCK